MQESTWESKTSMLIPMFDSTFLRMSSLHEYPLFYGNVIVIVVTRNIHAYLTMALFLRGKKE